MLHPARKKDNHKRDNEGMINRAGIYCQSKFSPFHINLVKLVHKASLQVQKQCIRQGNKPEIT